MYQPDNNAYKVTTKEKCPELPSTKPTPDGGGETTEGNPNNRGGGNNAPAPANGRGLSGGAIAGI